MSFGNHPRALRQGSNSYSDSNDVIRHHQGVDPIHDGFHDCTLSQAQVKACGRCIPKSSANYTQALLDV